LLSDRDDHGICGLSGSQCHAFFRGIGISVLQDEVGAFLELRHESDGVSGEGGSDGGEGVVELRGEVGTDGSEVRVGACLESGRGEVSDRVEEGSGKIADKLLDDAVHAGLEGIEWPTIGHVAL